MHDIFLEILILSGVATVISTACSFVRIPAMVGFIFTGLILGPSGFGVVASMPDASSLTELVGIVLLFTIGLEFPFSKLHDLRHQFFRLGTSQVVASIFVIAGLGIWVTGLLPPRAFLWGFLICLSSTALVLKLLHDYREVHTPHGQNAIGILLFQDVAVIPMMLLLPLMAKNIDGMEILSAELVLNWFLKIVAVALAVFLAKRYLIRFLMDLVLKTKSQELFFFGITFVALSIGYLFNLANLSIALGAFVAGVIIAETAFGRQTMTIFNSLRDTLLGLFFAAVGMLLDIQFIVNNLVTVLFFCFAFFSIKFLVMFTIFMINRVPLATSIMTALVLCQVGEFSFLLASQATNLGLLGQDDGQIFLSISVLSMALAPVLYMVAPKIAFSNTVKRFHSASTAQIPTIVPEESCQNHTVVIGYGIAGQHIVASLSDLAIPCKIIESNFKLVKSEREKGLDIHFGDASFPEVLKQVDLKNAKSVVIAISGSTSLPHIINSVRQMRPDVGILVRTQYLHDLRGLKPDQDMQVVVAEVETVSELLTRVLRVYGTEQEAIEEYVAETTGKLKDVCGALLLS